MEKEEELSLENILMKYGKIKIPEEPIYKIQYESYIKKHKSAFSVQREYLSKSGQKNTTVMNLLFFQTFEPISKKEYKGREKK